MSSLKRLTNGLQKSGFNVIVAITLRVKVLMMVDSLVLTFLTFLERFAITIEQSYPSSKVEKKIILGSMDKYGKKDEKFV